MNNYTFNIPPLQLKELKQKVSSWASRFDPCIILDSNEGRLDKYKKYELLVAVKPFDLIKMDNNKQEESIFERLNDFYKKDPYWSFGFIKYDLKNSLFDLKSNVIDPICFPTLMFFKPSILITIKDSVLEVLSKNNDAEDVWEQIQNIKIEPLTPVPSQNIKNRISKENYKSDFEVIKNHIQFGDFYEMNYCQEFYVENAKGIVPFDLFQLINTKDKSPFSAYVKCQNSHLMCASPERFVVKQNNTIISQPIKGTIARGKDVAEDKVNKEKLLNNPKDRSENVMIVDLVRNDLSQIAKRGSVVVKELFGIYPFEKVFQMISTVEAEIADNHTFSDALKALFPMGSMTGAPKLRVMQTIDKIEESNRGLYSGTVGYVDPDENFDFNVVIRSIQYNADSKYLSFHAGGAIVDKSELDIEYDECLLKVSSIRGLLNS